ncbi:TPA: hypothetical protein L2H11_003384 [Escherichia coli O25b:H4-ST131]|nr:hypothetical protein [Escherichia coli]EKK9422707.1 hypothetical protein [Escherichia coli]HBN3604804.1 hypothetical protein [Escherichia coli O25b:H4-ST131]
MLRGFFLSLINRLLFVVLFLSVSFYASAETAMRTNFQNGVSEMVNKILNSPDSDLRVWTIAASTFLAAVTAFVYFWRFVENGGALVDLFTLAIMFMLSMSLLASYSMVVDTITGAFYAISNELQRLALGNIKPSFLQNFVESVLTKAISAPSVDIFDGMNMVGMALLWEICSAILSVAIYLADVWIDVGTAIAKITGVMFIPFLVAPATRVIFDGWFKFYIGWGLAAVVLKITSIVVMIMIRASINSAGSFQGAGDVIASDGTVNGVLNITANNISLLRDICAYSVIAAIMVFSCFIFAYMIGSGVGSASQGLNNMAVKLAKKAAKALL